LARFIARLSIELLAMAFASARFAEVFFCDCSISLSICAEMPPSVVWAVAENAIAIASVNKEFL
jgi:hypothetical protein